MPLIHEAKTGEVIHIGDCVRLRIAKVRGDRVRLEIDAPPQIEIVKDANKTAKK